MNPEPGPLGGAEEEVLVVQRWPRWLPLLLGTALVAAVVVVIVVHEAGGTSTPQAAPTHPSASTSAPVTSPSASPLLPPLAVTDVGHPLLGATGSEELFGRGPDVVVRIELARGRVTTTTVPGLNSSGPVSFVLGRHEAIVRPLDLVPAYVVPDGRPAREFSGPLGDVHSGPVFPGPDGDSIWAETGSSDAPVLRLVPLDGSGPSQVLRIPRGASSIEGLPDGSGYVAFTTAGGTYDSTPAGLRWVTTGSVIAVGRTRWLVRRCDRHHRCGISVVDPHSGASHPLATSIGDADVAPGVVSPDGTAAGLVVLSPKPVLAYFDLRSGAEYALPLSLNTSMDPEQSLVWSPDSRWLFALDAAGRLHAVDARTHRITDFRSLGTALPTLTQIAIR